MLLARMIHYAIPSHKLYSLSASTLAIIFVSLDFVAFIIQLVGGSYAGPTSPVSQQLKGIHIYMGGIGLQQFFIVLFFMLAVKFHVEMRRMEKVLPSEKRRWRPVLFALYGTLGLITVSTSLYTLSLPEAVTHDTNSAYRRFALYFALWNSHLETILKIQCYTRNHIFTFSRPFLCSSRFWLSISFIQGLFLLDRIRNCRESGQRFGCGGGRGRGRNFWMMGRWIGLR